MWIFGFFQIFSNVGYALVAHQQGINRPLMYGAFFFEAFASGLGGGAFLVLMLRMTQKRFSATQYALFSSLFGLPRLLAGPICGFAVDAIGWSAFFWLSIAAGLPGLVLLARFVPWGVREPELHVEPPRFGRPLTTAELALRAALGGAVGLAVGAATSALLSALKAMRPAAGAAARQPFDLLKPLAELASPHDLTGWVTVVGILVFALVCGLFTAAVAAARHGAGQGLATDEPAVHSSP